MNQKDIVYNIVKEAGGLGIRTEQIGIQAMHKGVSCSSRYLRWLQEDSKIFGTREDENRTFTWRVCEKKLPRYDSKTGVIYYDPKKGRPIIKIKKPKQQSFLNPVHQEIIDNITLKPLTKEYMRTHSQDIKEILA